MFTKEKQREIKDRVREGEKTRDFDKMIISLNELMNVEWDD